MKRSFILLAAAAFTSPAWAQTTTPPAASTAPSTTTAPAPIKPRGPDAVAAQDPSRVVAIIDGKKLTAKEADEMLKPFPPEQRKQYEANLPKFIQQIYTRQRLAENAQKLNLEQESPWKERLTLAREDVLAQAYVAHVTDAANKAPADDPQKYYDAHPTEFDMTKLSGIFVSFNPPGTPANSAAPNSRTEEQARQKADDLEKKIKAGPAISPRWPRRVRQSGECRQGWRLGTYPLSDPGTQIPPDIKGAIQKLKPGEVSEPVRVGNALLIIKVDSEEKVTFEKARPAIVQKLAQEKSQAALKQRTRQIQHPNPRSRLLRHRRRWN